MDQSCPHSENKTSTYVFEVQDSDETNKNKAIIPSILWQIVPSLAALSFCLPFGMMLGWPSPSFPILLEKDAPVPITMVLSPLVAAFLMYGNVIGTILGRFKLQAAKHGILIALIVQTIGWVVIWQATNFYFLLGGRGLVGMAHGYGIAQVRLYIKDLCSTKLGTIFLRLVNPFIALGVLLIYIIGPFVDFRTLSLVGMAITICIFAIMFYLPFTATEELSLNNVNKARKMLMRANKVANIEEEINKLKVNAIEVHILPCRLFCMKGCKRWTLLLFLITFAQQFSGMPATIVYCQFMFTNSKVPNSQFCAMVYGAAFLFSISCGTLITSQFNKKYTLAASAAGVVTILAVNTTVIYYNFNERYFGYTSLLLMVLYIFFHSLGLGSVPFTLPDYLFPPHARRAAAQLHIIWYSIFAVIITKLFQVFYTDHAFYVMFCFFTAVALFGLVITILFVPKESPNVAN